jgi:hypothetical protein
MRCSDHRDGAGDRRKGAERGGAAVVAIADLGRERRSRRRAQAEGRERDRRRGSGGDRTVWVLVNMVSLVDERNARATNSESDRAIRRNEGGADYVLAM